MIRKRKINVHRVKKGSLMWKLLGFDILEDPNSDLRKALDRIAEADKRISNQTAEEKK